jgi:type IV secretion system protein VirB4
MDLIFGTGIGLTLGYGLSKLLEKGSDYKKDIEGLDDIISYSDFVDDHTIYLKDNSLLTNFKFYGIDAQALGQNEINNINEYLSSVLKSFGNNWLINFNTIRKPMTSVKLTNEYDKNFLASRLIESSRLISQRGKFYKNENYLSFTYRFGDKDIVDLQKVLEVFNSKIETTINDLSVNFNLKRMKIDSSMYFLNYCLNQDSFNFSALDRGNYIASSISYKDIQSRGLQSDRIKVGDRYLAVVTLYTIPAETNSLILNKLKYLPFEYRWSNRIVTFDSDYAEKKIKSNRRTWQDKEFGFSEIIKSQMSSSDEIDDRNANRDAVSMVDDSNEALESLQSSSVNFFNLNSSIVIADKNPDRLNDKVKAVTRTIRKCKFTGKIEVSTLDSFLGTLPGNAYYGLRQHLLSTNNIADIIPVFEEDSGNPSNPSNLFPENSSAISLVKTSNNSPYYLNLHDKDVGHTILVGSTGSGKSVIIQYIINQWNRYNNAKVFLFDVGYSGHLSCIANKGSHYDILPEDGTSGMIIDPFRNISQYDSHNDVYVHDKIELNWCQDWLETIAYLQGHNLTATEKKEIYSALENMADDVHISHRDMSTLVRLLQNSKLKNTFHKYTRQGVYGNVFDLADESINENSSYGFNSNYNVFEIGKLLEMEGDDLKMPLLMYMFHKVESQLSTKYPTLIIIEEAWSAFSNSRFQKKLKEWLVTLRKKNASVMLASHSASQLSDLEQPNLFIDSCPTKILAPNPDALDSRNKTYYEMFGLNEREIRELSKSQKKKHYMIKNPAGSKIIDLSLDSVALAFVTNPDGLGYKQINRKINQLESNYGNSWQVHWLKSLGIDVSHLIS